jgi:hypothetical protein
MRGINHREGRDPGIGYRLQRGLVAIRVHDRDYQRAALVLAKLGRLWPLHFDDNVGILYRIRADGCPGRGKFRIRQAGFDAGARLDRDLNTQRLEFLHRVGRSRNPRFGGIDFGCHSDAHRKLQVDQAKSEPRLALMTAFHCSTVILWKAVSLVMPALLTSSGGADDGDIV